MSEHKEPIPSMIYNAAVGGHVTNSQQIIDENENKEQSQINAEVKQNLGQGGSVDNRINQAKNDIIGSASSNGNTLKKIEDRVSPLESVVGSGGSIDSRISNSVAAETSRAITAEEQLRTLYNNLQQSQPIPVTALPATGEADKIYRLAGTTSYSDYMWNGSSWVKMAEYDNAIDNVPTAGSNNLVKSDGVWPYAWNNTHILNEKTFAYSNENIVTGNKLTPYTTIPKSFIACNDYESHAIIVYNGTMPDNFSIDVYDISNFAGKVLVFKGMYGHNVSSTIYCFSENSSITPNPDLDYLIIPGVVNFGYTSNLIYIPIKAKYLFLQKETEYNLFYPTLYVYNGISNKVVTGKTILTPINSLIRKYITQGNVLSDIGDDNFIVDIYDISGLQGKDIIINGTAVIDITTTIFSFSTQSNTIDSLNGYTAVGDININNVAFRVPTAANYLFVERVIYSPVADTLKVYQQTYEDININNTLILNKIEEIDSKNTPNDKKSLNIGRLAVIGDSIGQGATTSEQSRMAWTVIANRLGMTRNYNTSLGEYCYGDTLHNGINDVAGIYYDTTRKGLYSLIPQQLVGDERLIFMQAGTNDHGESIPLGVPYIEKYILYAHPTLPDTPYDNPLPEDDPNKQYERIIRVPSYDVTTTCGGFNEAVKRLYDTLNQVNIVVLLPIKKHISQLYYDSGYSNMKNYHGLYQQDYIDAIVECAEFWGLPIIRTDIMDMNPYNQTVNARYFNEGIHPNDIGHYKLAGFIIQNLKNIYFMPEINGTVKDSSDNPVSGAVVRLSLGNIDSNNGWELTTDVDGKYHFDGIFFGDAGDLTVTCTYNSNTLTEVIRVYESTNNIDFKYI